LVHIMSICGEQCGVSRMTEKSIKGNGSHIQTKNDE
jgi:hypothetical protein